MFKTVTAPKTTSDSTGAKSVSQWAVGEVYTGFLVERKKVRTRYGEADVLVFQNADEEGNVTEGQSSFIMSRTLGGLLEQVQDTQLCRIECLGKTVGAKSIQFNVGVADKFLPISNAK